MPAQSEVSICNLALTALSSSTIESLTQNNNNARKCNAVYSFLRDNMLANHNWDFAMKEATLAQVADTPISTNWSYIYQLPTDCLRVVYSEGAFDFEIIGDKLYNNDDSSIIQYVAQITDAGAFPAYFAKALAAEIASVLAFGITQNASIAQAIKEDAKMVLKEAKWSDAQEGDFNKSKTSSFITARQARNVG